MDRPKQDTLNLESHVAELQRILSDIDWGKAVASAKQGAEHGLHYLLVYELNHTKLHIYSNEGSHKAPHFHLEYKREFSAAYDIRTLERIVGNMPRKYEQPILEWARTRQGILIDAWNRIARGEHPLIVELESQEEP